MTRTITITGGKGGVGKTNISVNLSLSLSKLGAKVCVFDADLGLANINILLGLYPDYNLEDVLLQGRSLEEILIKDYNGIDIIPGSSGVEEIANLDKSQLDGFIKSFSDLGTYDFFIFDTSAGISKSVISFCLAASEVIIVITPEPTSLTDAYALLKVLCLNEFNGSVRVVVNQCSNTQAARHTYNRFRDVVKRYLSVDIVPLGIVVRDRKFPEAVRKQQPLVMLYPESGAAKCIQVMATRLMSNKPEDFKTDGIESFWTSFLKLTKSPLKLIDAPKVDSPGPQSARDNSGKPLGDVNAHTSSHVLPHSKDETRGSSLDRLELSGSLPSLPHILLKLIEVCGGDDSDIQEIAKIAENDPSLCARILRMVNSSCYSLPQKVKSLRQAMTFLGTETVRNIAVSASVSQVFDGLKKDSTFNMKLFWWHSLMCAVLANKLAKKISYSMPDETFLCGLLHDVGKLVLLKNFPSQYHEMVKGISSYGELVVDEQKQFGFTHCEAGFNLVNHWNLQSFIGDTILYHHEPVGRIVNSLPLVKIIYVANALANNIGNKLEIAEEVLGLKQEDVESLVSEAEEEVEQTARSLDIDVEAPGAQEPPVASEQDAKIQEDLNSEVRDVSLVLGVLQNLINAQDIDSILGVAASGMSIVFDIHDQIFFLYDRSQKILSVANIETDFLEGVEDISIPFQDEKSMIVSALKSGNVMDSFSCSSRSGLTIIDEQLIRLMGKKGIICFPMAVREEFVGVVVVGMDSDQACDMNKRLKLLCRFLNYVAFSLHAERTRQQRVQDLLTERMAATTSVARKVAHEVNNPLSIIKNYLKILEITLSEQNIMVDEIRIINDEIARVSQIIEELSDFSKSQNVNPEEVNVNNLLDDMVLLIKKSLIKKGVSVETDMDPELPVIVSDRNSLKKIFINLIKNASEALADKGSIFVRTKSFHDRGFIEVTVSDSGSGLPERIRSRLFEPYISTKGEGHSGLGLSIVYSAVKNVQAHIDCTSEEGRGTAFKITFPMSIDKKLIP